MYYIHMIYMFLKFKVIIFKRSLSNRSIISYFKIKKNGKKNILKIRDLTNSKLWRYKRQKLSKQYLKTYIKFLAKF